MAQFVLINTVQVGSTKYFAGETIDDTVAPKADIVAAGGVCWPIASSIVAAQGVLVVSKRLNKAINENECNALMLSAAGSQAEADAAASAPAAAASATAAAASATAAAASAASVPVVQAGTGTLALGTATIAANLGASSRIVVSMKDPGAGAITGMSAFDIPAGGRTPGAPGSFVVNAIDGSKATITTAICTFEWIVVG